MALLSILSFCAPLIGLCDVFLMITSAYFLSRFVIWLVAIVFPCYPFFGLFVYLKFLCPVSLLFSLWHWAHGLLVVKCIRDSPEYHGNLRRTGQHLRIFHYHCLFHFKHVGFLFGSSKPHGITLPWSPSSATVSLPPLSPSLIFPTTVPHTLYSV